MSKIQHRLLICIACWPLARALKLTSERAGAVADFARMLLLAGWLDKAGLLLEQVGRSRASEQEETNKQRDRERLWIAEMADLMARKGGEIYGRCTF